MEKCEDFQQGAMNRQIAIIGMDQPRFFFRSFNGNNSIENENKKHTPGFPNFNYTMNEPIDCQIHFKVKQTDEM